MCCEKESDIAAAEAAMAVAEAEASAAEVALNSVSMHDPRYAALCRNLERALDQRDDADVHLRWVRSVWCRGV